MIWHLDSILKCVVKYLFPFYLMLHFLNYNLQKLLLQSENVVLPFQTLVSHNPVFLVVHDYPFSTYKNEKTYSASGYFEENIKKNNINEYSTQISSLKKVDWVMGCSMLIDLDKFSSKKLFDENFFLYFEEFDLCKRIKDKGEDVFVSKDLIIDHLGNMGSFATDKNLKFDAEKLREWHWMWSTFYFYKKNYGFFYALKKTMGKLLRSFVKMIYYYLIFNRVLKAKYTCRFMGLLNSIFGKKSWYRVNSQYQ